jgi:hypothetical protein
MKRALLSVCTLLAASSAYAAPESVDQLNELLRGEISAVETYQQALGKVGDDPQGQTIKSFLKDNQTNVEELTADIERLGGSPAKSSGAWGAWAKTVEGTSKLFGDAAALKALKEGEQHGLKEHKEMASDETIPGDIREKIKNAYIPKQEQHIQSLDQMIDKAS